MYKNITAAAFVMFSGASFAGSPMWGEMDEAVSGTGWAPFGTLWLIVLLAGVGYWFVTEKTFRFAVLGYLGIIFGLGLIFKIFGKEWGIAACLVFMFLVYRSEK